MCFHIDRSKSEKKKSENQRKEIRKNLLSFYLDNNNFVINGLVNWFNVWQDEGFYPIGFLFTVLATLQTWIKKQHLLFFSGVFSSAGSNVFTHGSRWPTMQCFYLHNVSLNVQLNMSCPCSRLCRESDHLSTQFQRPSPEMWYELQRYTCLKRNSILSRFSWRIIVAQFYERYTCGIKEAR